MKDILLLMTTLVLVVGCLQPICNEPYILVGNDCCLDVNDNNICDSDEITTTEITTTTEATTVGPSYGTTTTLAGATTTVGEITTTTTTVRVTTTLVGCSAETNYQACIGRDSGDIIGPEDERISYDDMRLMKGKGKCTSIFLEPGEEILFRLSGAANYASIYLRGEQLGMVYSEYNHANYECSISRECEMNCNRVMSSGVHKPCARERSYHVCLKNSEEGDIFDSRNDEIISGNDLRLVKNLDGKCAVVNMTPIHTVTFRMSDPENYGKIYLNGEELGKVYCDYTNANHQCSITETCSMECELAESWGDYYGCSRNRTYTLCLKNVEDGDIVSEALAHPRTWEYMEEIYSGFRCTTLNLTPEHTVTFRMDGADGEGIIYVKDPNGETFVGSAKNKYTTANYQCDIKDECTASCQVVATF